MKPNGLSSIEPSVARVRQIGMHARRSQTRLMWGAAVLLLVACDPGSDAAVSKHRTEIPENAEEVTCKEAMYSRQPSGWQKEATSVDGFGFFGKGRDFKKAHRTNPAGSDKTPSPFVTKVPIVLEGNREVTIWVPEAERERIGMVYGTRMMIEAGDFSRLSATETSLRLIPCSNRSRTSWPGGFVMTTRQPVTVHVAFEGAEESYELVVGNP